MQKHTVDKLLRLQNNFLSALQHPHQPNYSPLQQSIKSNARMSGMECLAIYQRSYYSRLLACMREQFPALCHCLGEALFDDFSREYLKVCKPSSYTLYDLGRRFPEFLIDTQPTQNGDGPQETWIRFMLDLAGFEHTVFSLFDAPGNEEESDIFATQESSDQNLSLQSCFALGSYQFDVASYYHRIRNKEEPSLPPIESTKIALVRKDYLTHTLFLSDPHYHFLNAMQKGQTVDNSLRLVAEQFNLPVDQVFSSWHEPDGIRSRWIKSGFFLDEHCA